MRGNDEEFYDTSYSLKERNYEKDEGKKVLEVVQNQSHYNHYFYKKKRKAFFYVPGTKRACKNKKIKTMKMIWSFDDWSR